MRPSTIVRSSRRKFDIVVAVVALAVGVALQVVPFTGPWYSHAIQIGETTLLHPTWRAAAAPWWAHGIAWDQAQQVAPDMPDTDRIYDQFMCHWVFARPLLALQTTWGLDADRPDVGPVKTVLAACNPR